ncbi:MAG: hypothetical protein QME96_06825 [Myxococcota bacterium]|nr:hypothetical protein [Myxococcota bacterium]
MDPLDVALIELAVLLDHEARHHATDAWGQHHVIPHTCADCRDPIQRAHDPIYREDGRVRKLLCNALQPTRPADVLGDVLKGAAVVTAGTLVICGAAKLLDALLKPRRRHAARHA